MSEKLWYLKNCHLFEQLADGDLRDIEARSKARTFARGTPIYLPLDDTNAVFLLASGRVKICHLTPDGKQSILAFIEPGELFGELAMLETGGVRNEYAESVEKSTIVLIPGEIMQKTMESNAGLTLGVTKMIGMRRRRIEQRLKNLLFLSNRERLTHLLLELAEQYGVRESAGLRLRIQLSHQDLANVIGSTRETVTVVLGEMQQEGLLSIGRRRIVILDLGRLAGSVQRSAPSIPVRPLGR
ncbi:MAG TPA: Crp/Fnr family transcriptional regulator [Pirellulaceae bacterium]|nr:Crp/Fnr family transcriptional regulator [Planctomycetales bacterium]MCB9939656.1 Crp/Fnr family transcriptional regulator [Planctomycetaceae bacterium]HRX78985.1 Crp/Fnr family transcriptional regulator [Pirellulaceae bacterium]